MPKPKNKEVARSAIEKALVRNVVQALGELDLPQDGKHLCRTFRALVGLALSLMSAGDAPSAVVSEQLDRVLRRKGLQRKSPVPHVPPGTIGSCVLKPGKA